MYFFNNLSMRNCLRWGMYERLFVNTLSYIYFKPDWILLCICVSIDVNKPLLHLHFVWPCYVSVRETLWNFIGHSVLLGESFHRTELLSVWLWVYIIYIVFETTSDNLVRLEKRQIGPITYLSCRSDGPMNLADTVMYVFNVAMLCFDANICDM